DCVNHSKIELEARRSVAACIDVNAGGADVEARIRQPSTYRRRELVESVDPHRTFVKRRAPHLPPVQLRHSLRAPNRIALDGHDGTPSRGVVRSYRGLCRDTTERPAGRDFPR